MDELDSMFADYRSEWIRSDFDERFVEPPYYQRFLGIRPTFLLGGRGTGKTVALRSLHFSNKDTAGRPRHLGIYVKAFKNRVTAFSGTHLTPDTRVAAFEHYMNLLCCIELADMCHEVLSNDNLTASQLASIRLLCEHFSVKVIPTSYSGLYDELRVQLARLTKFVVAPRLLPQPPLSPGESPVVDFAKDIHDSIATNREPIYICVDEWENLSEAQQEAMNGWIKNSAEPISYKLGVRQGGIRTRETGRSDDPLACPADYSDEDVSGDEHFCMQVVEKRLDLARKRGFLVPPKLSAFLHTVEPAKEAQILGSGKLVERAATDQDREGHASVARWLRQAPPDEAYLALHLSQRGLGNLSDIIAEARANDSAWARKIDNYRYASLFTITKGRRGVSLRKLYTGSKTFLTLSGGNVRYLLELLDEVVRIHLREAHDGTAERANTGETSIDGLIQSRAAMSVAKRHLDQIPGLSTRGFTLARLVRSVGTVLHELIRNPRNNAPEQTGFTLTGEKAAIEQARSLLDEGCAVLSFVCDEPTKLTHPTETQQQEYRLHPILAPHFNISHRRKRRRRIDAALLIDAAESVDGASALLKSITGQKVSQRQMQLLSQ